MNRLAHESSPYLLMHAENPIDWYPWGPEAFEGARRENKPIFLSIGYSSCYWCHVMERQVFSKEEIAQYMNEHFINIKVDREERPDIDDVYMTALQVYYQLCGIRQSGGWPLSIFLTPSGKPFAGGTYFPPTDQRGLVGFPTVLRRVVELWNSQRETVEKNAELVVTYVKKTFEARAAGAPAVRLDRSLVDRAVRDLGSSFDTKFGGLDFNPAQPMAPKFPVPPKLMFLKGELARCPDPKTAALLELTLDRMAAGGIRDHLAGGFHRYSTDREWLIPHFEKMLYDNAQLAEVYRRTGKQLYREVAEETFSFLLREMRDPQGGFYSALDAETERVEGKFYVWSEAEVDWLLGPADAALFKRVYGVVAEPHFEHGNVLRLAVPIEQAAAEQGLSVKAAGDRLTLMRRKLLEARNQRQRPFRDEKMLTGWNGLTIRALAAGSQILKRTDYRAAAERAAYFILDRMRDPRGRLLRSHCRGTSKVSAYLDDYAFLVSGLIALHKVTGETKWLNAARRLTDDQITLFWDDRDAGFFLTATDQEQIFVRPKNIFDSVLPSENGVSVQNLLHLFRLTNHAPYREYAERALGAFAFQIKETPAATVGLVAALSQYLELGGEPIERAAGQPTTADASSPAAPSPRPVVKAEGALVPIATTGKDITAPGHRLGAHVFLDRDQLPAGGTCRVAVILEVAPGWHINANPSRPPFLIPTTVILESKQGTTLIDVAYPNPRRLTVRGVDEPVHVYEGRVALYGRLRVPAASQAETLRFKIRYQACNDNMCESPKTLLLEAQVAIAPKDRPTCPINAPLFH